MDSSLSTLRVMARGIYRTVLPTGLGPRIPIHRRSLSSGVYSLFSRTQALSHERTTIAGPPCPSSSALKLNLCPVRKHWRDGRNFGRLVGFRRTSNLRRRKSSQRPRSSGIST